MKSALIALAGTELAKQLEAYFEVVEEWVDGRNDLGLLSAAQAIEQTNSFRTFHPIVRDLKGVILDDPGTSDHHLCLCQEPFRGAVMCLMHDGESRIIFDSIEAFLIAARQAAKQATEIVENHPKLSWIAPDQAALKDLIIQLRSSLDGDDIIPTLLPSLNLSDTDFLSALVEDDDLFVSEAVGREIAARPAPHLVAVAKLCEEHRHSQVRDAGILALKRIATL